MPNPSHHEGSHKAVRPIGGYVLADEPVELNAGRLNLSVDARSRVKDVHCG